MTSGGLSLGEAWPPGPVRGMEVQEWGGPGWFGSREAAGGQAWAVISSEQECEQECEQQGLETPPEAGVRLDGGERLGAGQGPGSLWWEQVQGRGWSGGVWSPHRRVAHGAIASPSTRTKDGPPVTPSQGGGSGRPK